MGAKGAVEIIFREELTARVARQAQTLAALTPDIPIVAEEAVAAFNAAIDAGIRYIDTARIYDVAEERLKPILARRREEIFAYCRSRPQTLYHPVGTCRMGSDSDAVVGDRLAVHGIADLWVADASVMPTITTGHPNAAVVAIGEARALVRYFSALSGICNHVGGPLGHGRIEGEHVVCPWHNWKYHRVTGEGEPGFEDRASSPAPRGRGLPSRSSVTPASIAASSAILPPRIR